MKRSETPRSDKNFQLVTALALWALFMLAWILWRPGLTGGFIFDDFPNLSGLSQISADPTIYSALQYILSGISSELGRPLSLVTFALQHESWPNNPAEFVYVNILIHFLNALLLFWWLWRWNRMANGARPIAALLPLGVTFLWLLAPLQVTAVLYVVQRMALLATTCVLAGILMHTVGRETAVNGRIVKGYVLMAAAWAVGIGAGTLAKESAVLFPLLILVYETTLMRAVPRPPRWRDWCLLTIALPVGLLVGYLLWNAPATAAGYEFRPFTAGERLLTEARVLFVYLWKLLLPTPYGIRLLYDDFAISRSFLEPWTTLPAVFGWVLGIAAALRWRARFPAFSFGVLWFLAAHSLESTILPLELAFEHRNYAAIIGPLLALLSGASYLFQTPPLRRIRPVLGVGLALYFALVTACLWQASSLWGDPRARANYWAVHQPESARAVHEFGAYLFVYGRVDEGRRLYELAARRWPQDITMPLTLLKAGCDFPDMSVPLLDEVKQALRDTDAHVPTLSGTLEHLVQSVEDGECRRYPIRDLQELLDTALESPGLSPLRQNLLLFRSRLSEADQDRITAMHYLDLSIRIRPNIAMLKQGVLWALQQDDVETAKSYVMLATTSRAISPLQRWSNRLEIAGLKQVIELYEAVTKAAPAEPDIPVLQIPSSTGG